MSPPLGLEWGGKGLEIRIQKREAVWRAHPLTRRRPACRKGDKELATPLLPPSAHPPAPPEPGVGGQEPTGVHIQGSLWPQGRGKWNPLAPSPPGEWPGWPLRLACPSTTVFPWGESRRGPRGVKTSLRCLTALGFGTPVNPKHYGLTPILLTMQF